jgi:hypothetical protein
MHTLNASPGRAVHVTIQQGAQFSRSKVPCLLRHRGGNWYASAKVGGKIIRRTEADLVIEARDGTLCGLEMKFGSTVRAGDFVGLRHLRETVGPKFRHGYVVHGGDRFVSFAPDLHALPVAALRGIS